jgi:ABC-type sugar transport system substrate-binding protein
MRKRTVILAAATVVAAMTLAACSSSSAPPSAGGGGTSGAASTDVNVSDADVQKTVNKAFQADVPLSSLPATVQEALKRATLTLSADKLNTAYDCWNGASCTIPGGGNVTLGIADGFGQNQWRKFSKMELILQALTYPQVGKVISTDAQGDLAAMQSNIRSLAAQGAKAIVTYDDFGAAAVPAFQAAAAQGAKISSYVGPVPDAPTTAVQAQVHGDTCQAGKDMAKVATDDLKLSGSVAILNGTPGNPQGQSWNKCFGDDVAGKLTIGTKLDTSWTPAGTFSAASALVSSGKTYTGIFYDYADPMPQVIQAYEKAGKITPALVTWTSNNGLFKEWESRQGTPKAFELYFTNGLNWQARVSVTAVMDLLDGKTVDNQLVVPQPFVKATKGIYQSDRPDDYPGPSVLVPDSLVDRMLQ